jgi:Bifunctional DNA primase/polymerase, N-terminal
MSSETGAQALDYAARGWPVFPTRHKIPCIKDWPNAASCDPAQIEAWWKQWPDAVISIPTGERTGVIVLDVDVRNTRSGFDTLADLGKPILPETPISHTPSGGVHVWFARTELAIRNSAGIKGLGAMLDIRGDGGQVVLPSLSSGYWWDPHYNFDTVALMPAPAWLGHRSPTVYRLDFNNAPGQRSETYRRFDPRATLAECCRRIEQAAEGSRHDTYRQETFRVATMVRDRLLTEADARHALEPVIMALGLRADGHYGRVEKYYNLAFAEGLASPSLRRGR